MSNVAQSTCASSAHVSVGETDTQPQGASELLELLERHPHFRVDAPETTWELPIAGLQAQGRTGRSRT